MVSCKTLVFTLTFIMLTFGAICIEGLYTTANAHADYARQKSYIDQLKQVTQTMEAMKNSGIEFDMEDRRRLVGLEVRRSQLRDEIEEIDDRLEAVGYPK